MISNDFPSDLSSAVPSAVLSEERWQPLRCGILNIYKYDNEEFHFEKGRLLLRGNNGTGKSRVLALTLPFLFDGDVSPHRVEPDGDPAKRIEWNLLMNKYPDRIGYSWVEFGYRDSDGNSHFVTLGCGLKAVEGKGLAGKWFFITELRIGESLFLENTSHQPLTRDRLREKMGEQGRIYETVSSYRAAVDEALFKLGEHRYNALLNLLIQLRKPQLSRELNEEKLSAALSEALAPIHPGMVADVAEAFRGLENERQELESYRSSAEAADAFLKEYTVYAKIAARRRAARLRQSHYSYENTQEQLRSAKVAFEKADQGKAQKQELLKELHLNLAVLQTEERTLEVSPLMQHARELEIARKEAEHAKKERERCFEQVEALKKKVEQYQRQQLRAQEELDAAIRDFETRYEEAHQASMACDRESVFKLNPQSPQAKNNLNQDIDQQLQSIRHLQRLNQILETAIQKKNAAQRFEEELKLQNSNAVEQEKRAQEKLNSAVTRYWESFKQWRLALVELKWPEANGDLAGDLTGDLVGDLDLAGGPADNLPDNLPDNLEDNLEEEFKD